MSPWCCGCVSAFWVSITKAPEGTLFGVAFSGRGSVQRPVVLGLGAPAAHLCALAAHLGALAMHLGALAAHLGALAAYPIWVPLPCIWVLWQCIWVL